jgi:hypothetical protein
VAFVHSINTTNTSEEFIYKRFEAYYNEATDTVENNGLYPGDKQALFQFYKCMAEYKAGASSHGQ